MKLDFLEPVVAHKGPWATVYATTGPADESSARRRELTWRELCRSLEEQGADEATVGAVRASLDGLEPGADTPGIALFAAEGRTVLTRTLGQPPAATEAIWSEIPRLTPLLELTQQRPGCLVARIDRAGADFRMHGLSSVEDAGSVHGRDRPPHRAAPGAWSARHFGVAGENTWAENAARIAQEVVRVFADSDAELLVLAGGARECHSVDEHLPLELRDVTTISWHDGRAAGAETDRLDASIETARLEHAARAAENVLDRFRAGRDASGGDPAAIEGVPAVAEAARQHRIDTLLITPAGPDPRRELWIGEHPDQVAVRRSDAERLGAEHPHAARADDALLCSAVAAGGEAFVVPGDGGDGSPAGGIGALLRWPVGEAERTRG
ncbi:Vms1/Ankzf1 family peptidyl-tRNA hydrolase [Streptomyces sp. NPDC057411]|uniref:baeRF2 domain-containing protein n=1 Tax=unclassified Streptomyces TaxID=2593676 RepID=UPI003642E933